MIANGEHHMTAYIVWMDYNEAKVYELAPQETKRRQMKLHVHKHSKHPHGKHEQHHHPEADKWFHEVAESLKGDAKEVLLMGAGEAKKLFKTYLEHKHPHTLGKAVIGVETVDHPTEGQLLEKARQFFKQYDLFH
jgi:stalled ribosome rescue protein Dom34